MANMSYCRFRNTKKDLYDCIEALENRSISIEEEKGSASSMLNCFLKFCQEEGIIEGYDANRIEEILETCEEECE